MGSKSITDSRAALSELCPHNGFRADLYEEAVSMRQTGVQGDLTVCNRRETFPWRQRVDSVTGPDHQTSVSTYNFFGTVLYKEAVSVWNQGFLRNEERRMIVLLFKIGQSDAQLRWPFWPASFQTNGFPGCCCAKRLYTCIIMVLKRLPCSLLEGSSTSSKVPLNRE